MCHHGSLHEGSWLMRFYLSYESYCFTVVEIQKSWTLIWKGVSCLRYNSWKKKINFDYNSNCNTNWSAPRPLPINIIVIILMTFRVNIELCPSWTDNVVGVNIGQLEQTLQWLTNLWHRLFALGDILILKSAISKIHLYVYIDSFKRKLWYQKKGIGKNFFEWRPWKK